MIVGVGALGSGCLCRSSFSFRIAQDGLTWIRETLTLLRVPGLAAFGLRPQDADDIAAKALVSSSMKGNPVTLSHDDLNAILLQAL